MSSKPSSVLPAASRYPFDAVAHRILVELERRNWQVPGVRVWWYGDGIPDCVSRVFGEDFSIEFSADDSVRDWILSSPTSIVIPRRILRVHDGESWAILLDYVGDRWARDFRRYCRAEVDLHDLPGCKYFGLQNEDQYRPLLLQTKNAPEGVPTQLETAAVFEEFRAYLEEQVLPRILAHPVPEPA